VRDLPDRDAAGKFSAPLLQLLAVVVGGSGVDLLADLRDAAVGIGLGADAIDDRRIVVVDRDLLGAAERIVGVGAHAIRFPLEFRATPRFQPSSASKFH